MGRDRTGRRAPLEEEAAIAGALLLLPLHHAVAYFHHLHQAEVPLWGRERVWFAAKGTPQESLDHWVAQVEAGDPLDCRTRETPDRQRCTYDSIYSAVSGPRRWNGEPPIETRAVDPRDGKEVVLDPSSWHQQAIPPVSNRGRPRES